MPARCPPLLAATVALALAVLALSGGGLPPAAASTPCERDEGTLRGDSTIEGSWTATCHSAELGATTSGGSMFHAFTLNARAMATIELAPTVGDAEIVLRRGAGREGAALEEDAARIRIPLDAGTYTVEVADRSGAADSAYALAISLVEPPSMSYPTFDRAGRVEAAGSYSILATADGMPRDVETYEELRGEAADAFRLHVADGGGASHAAFLATVEAGDVFEWRAASDCWTRYQVTSATPPANGATAREFGVKWVTYAYSGCSGALPGTLAATVSWYPPDVGGVSLASPVVHGAFQLKPSLWTGAVQPGEVFDTPGGYPPLQSPEVFTTDVTVARSFPYWRDPELPRGWAFMSATGGGLLVSRGYCASYSGLGGYLALEVCGEHALGKWFATDASWLADRETDQPRLGVLETRMVAGRPAVIDFSPKGSFHYEGFLVSAIVYDAATDSLYAVSGRDPSLRGDNVDGVIAIARSLFERAAPAPPVTGHGRASASGHDVWYGAASGLRAGEVR